MADKKTTDKPEARESRTKAQLAMPTNLEAADRSKRTPDGSRNDPLHVAGRISLKPADVVLTDDAALWAAIRNRTAAIRGDRYEEFIKRVLCNESVLDHAVSVEKDDGFADIAEAIQTKRAELLASPTGYGVDAYNLLKYATQAFLLLETGVVIRSPRHPLNTSEDDINDLVSGEESRIGESISFKDLEARLEVYLGGALNGPLPYLKRIIAA